MTQLDEKALEAAWQTVLGIEHINRAELEIILRTYLDALPPARRAWGWYSGDNEERRPSGLLLYTTEDAARNGADPHDIIVPLEIREVRPSPPSVEG